jgi:hypothetical protein
MKRIITPWAASGTKNTVPDTAPATDTGVASYPVGFTPKNATPLVAGGVPVSEGDMNGVLNDITGVLAQNAQGLYITYDSSFSTAIGGYPLYAIFPKSADIGFWLNITAGNTTNPGTGGTGWIDFSPMAIQKGQYVYTEAAGSTTAYTATLTPAPAVLTDGMIISIDTGAVGTNTTTTPTLNVNGLGAKTQTKQGGVALMAGDVPKFAQYQYDGAATAWILLNPAYRGLLNVQIFTSTGTYTATPGTNYVIVEVMGAGAGGGGVANSPANYQSCSGGGGSGAYAKVKITSAFSGVTVTVGAAGVGGVSYADGSAGGTSSFGTLVSCAGCSGTGNKGQSYLNYVGNTSSGGGGGVAPSITGTAILAYKGDTSKGGYTFNASGSQTGAGGASPLGSPGWSVSGSFAGNAASGYGAGGSGAASLGDNVAKNGGNGGNGVVIVWEYK